MCPAPGMLPQFKGSLNQIVNDYCLWYTRDEAGARDAAFCLGGIGISDGSGDGTLAPSSLSGAPPLRNTPDLPRLSPEGDELWVRGDGRIYVYTRAGDHAWGFVRDLGLMLSSGIETFTPPTRKVAGKRRFVMTTLNIQNLQEWEDDGAQLTMVGQYTNSQEGSAFFLNPTLTADGLRLVWSGATFADPNTNLTLYADRGSLSETFSTAKVLTSAPVVTDPFLTADCGRIYTSGLGSIFYAEQP